MKNIFTISFVILFYTQMFGQIEVDGTAKISDLPNQPSSGRMVVADVNGNLGVNQIQIGGIINGGIVFYLDNTGQHGLVCSVVDQNGVLPWSLNASNQTLAFGQGIGSGEMNTTLIIANQAQTTAGGQAYAAGVCGAYVYDDGTAIQGGWYLPTAEELKQLFAQFDDVNASAAIAGGTSLIDSPYWSSQDGNATAANYFWYNEANAQNLGLNFVGSNLKTTNYRVRCIKKF